jgi:hypothetical protein
LLKPQGSCHYPLSYWDHSMLPSLLTALQLLWHFIVTCLLDKITHTSLSRPRTKLDRTVRGLCLENWLTCPLSRGKLQSNKFRMTGVLFSI